MSAAPKHDVYQAIADSSRREMLMLLAKNDASIKEISKHFSISRTAIVKHLNVLSDANLVSDRKVGRSKIYSLQPEQLAEVREWVSYFEQFWDNKLSMLRHMVEENVKE
ncbi:winged helix-turn-helix transcriptional regulator [Alkalihalobacillus hwajinpoensis]|uniref:ArsR/SmtB family transcription factor n=1 Tax=Guptibacillus hwajinpoensis TaxID=208199 RepID=UPI0018833D01|nr:metalloregulator ArsR/SmtB family transcription factor [Pseudalkalibacillus hwajinpoensis]MBF0707727.1 winged helix-turn-helix transcriptional regulator [Pseudalkalibacillus hwajinpoensis]